MIETNLFSPWRSVRRIFVFFRNIFLLAEGNLQGEEYFESPRRKNYFNLKNVSSYRLLQEENSLKKSLFEDCSTYRLL